MMSKTLFILAVLLKVNGYLAKENMNISGTDDKPESNNEIFNNFMADAWLDGTDMVKVLWRDCTKPLAEKQLTSLKKESLSPVMHCIKRKTLMALDRSLSSDVIPIVQGVQLVRFENINPTGDVMRHAKSDGKTPRNVSTTEALEKGEWKYLVLERMANVFNTHVLKLDINNNESHIDEIPEFRHRRRHQMVQMMMFGIVSMGMVLVPMGFQFLAVLGGKALLLAKLALILTSIQGLKKVATSPLNYGLYHSHQGTPFDSSSTFEKRGHSLLFPTPETLPAAPTEEWHQKADDESTKSESTDDKLKYRFDSDSKVWKFDSPKMAKRSSYNIVDGVNVYPVYAVSPGEGTFGQAPSQAVSGYPTGAGVPLDTLGHINNNPAEIHAEYTIDFPVNKLQLKSSSPIGFL